MPREDGRRGQLPTWELLCVCPYIQGRKRPALGMCHRVVVNVAMAWEHGSRLPVNPGSLFPPKQDTKHPQYSTCPCCIARISSSLEHVLVRVLMHADSAIWTHRQRAADGRPRYACARQHPSHHHHHYKHCGTLMTKTWFDRGNDGAIKADRSQQKSGTVRYA